MTLLILYVYKRYQFKGHTSLKTIMINILLVKPIFVCLTIYTSIYNGKAVAKLAEKLNQFDFSAANIRILKHQVHESLV